MTQITQTVVTGLVVPSVTNPESNEWIPLEIVGEKGKEKGVLKLKKPMLCDSGKEKGFFLTPSGIIFYANKSEPEKDADRKWIGVWKNSELK